MTNQLEQAALRDSVERSHLAINIAQLGTWHYDPATDQVALDDRMCAIWGERPGAVLSLASVFERLHPDDRTAVGNAVAAALNGRDGGRYASEFRIVWSDGSVRWLAANGQAHFAPTPEPRRATGFLGTAPDITERKRAEQALRDSEDRYRAFVANSSEGVYRMEFDPPIDTALPLDEQVTLIYRNGRFAECNDAFAHVYGFRRPAEVVGHGLDLMLPSTDAAARAYLCAAIEAGYRVVDAESAEYDLQGRPLYFANSLSGVVEDGRLVRVWGVQRDITGRKLVEAALRDSEAKYRTLFTSIDQGFCLIEMLFAPDGTPSDYRFVEINPLFEQQTGLRDAMGKTARQLVPDLEARWFAIYGKVALTGEAVRFEDHSAPMQRWFDVYAWRVGDADSRLVALLFKDITERKLAEAERERLLWETEQARQTAEAAVNARDQFLSIASHELRTPMTTVIGYAELLQRRGAAGNLPDAQRNRLVDHVLRHARRLNRLLVQLLDVTQLQRGQLALQQRPLELGELVERVIEDVRLGLGDTKDRWPITLERPLEALVVGGDGERLEQALVNLLNNAVKYSPDGGPVRVGVARRGTEATVEITDCGIGIPEQSQAHLFDAFYRAPNVGDVRGFGIGLHVVHAIVERHGGRLELESADGQGSTFRVLLPLVAGG